MRLRFTPESLRSIRDKRRWWEEHRTKAPRLFVEELAAVVGKLRDGADQERQQYAARRGRIIWRLLMPRTRHHVYYRIDADADSVEVLLVWNAVAGSAPAM